MSLRHKLDEARKSLASKSTDASSTTLISFDIARPKSCNFESKVPLPGGNWSVVRESNNNNNNNQQHIESPQKVVTINSSDHTQSLLSSASLPDFVLRSLIDKSLNDKQNTNEYRKRINTTRKVFADLERKK